MNNFFEGFGIFTVRYKVLPKKVNQDLDDSLAQDPEGQPQVEYMNDIYEGEWRNSTKHGNGTEHYSNGDFFVGHFREGTYDGTGKYVWKNGSSYAGHFKKGRKSGKGKWTVIDNAPGITAEE